jgi:hypothetical protein
MITECNATSNARQAEATTSTSVPAHSSTSEMRLRDVLAKANEIRSVRMRACASFSAVLQWRCDEKTIGDVSSEQLKKEVIATLKGHGISFPAYETQSGAWGSAFNGVPTLLRSQRLDPMSGKKQWFVSSRM